MEAEAVQSRTALRASPSHITPRPRISKTYRRPRPQKTLENHMKSMPPTRHLEFANNDRNNLLATKSNYEWVAEGRHTELGLHFPDTMVASISSKRTTHSAAEQGRRDRLKSAFEDMAEVLFSGNAQIDQEERGTSEGRSTSNQESNGRKGNLNKIKLINMAIERLKAQCKQIEDMKRMLDDKGCGHR